MIDGRRYLPLIMAFARTHYMARNDPGFDYANDVVYDQMRRVYNAGIRIFQPCMPEIGWGPDGQFDYTNFDTVLRRLVELMPEAYFILRVIIPPPPLPVDEQIQVSRRPGDSSDAKACQVFDQISLFSETYRDYAPGAMIHIMEHLASLPEAGRIIGTVICGAGFEWNWGNPGGNWGLMMDICPAVTREFGRFLQRKYGTIEALRSAWGDPDADFENPPLPGIEDRTHSDICGFRDPSQSHSRWIQDFLDCYNDQPTRILTHIFDRLRPQAVEDIEKSLERGSGNNLSSERFAPTQPCPPLFHGVFHLGTMNTAFSGVQTMESDFSPILEHPALGFITSPLGYQDRYAGGVSAYINTSIKSHELHDKLALGEADIRPGTSGDPWDEDCIEDGIASMRREFAVMALVQRHGLWYFDMPGGWFDRPELLEELKRQQQVGDALLDVPHTSVAETLVVFENRSWKYFGLADHKLALKTVWSGENQQLLSDMTQANIENIQRLGAPNDAIVAEDFLHPSLVDSMPGSRGSAPAPPPERGAPSPDASKSPRDTYKLLIFPFSFLCEPAMREEIHRRVEAGATALFLYAAGITDGETASLANMERLLGMKVQVEQSQPLVATLDEDVLHQYGMANSERQIGNPKTEHFHYVIDDPRATPLAHYEDGAVAAAMIERGKGRIILSATPAASPALYRLAARIADVHIYNAQDDALYASGEFLVIHTRDQAGPRALHLPATANQVTEVFTHEVVARHTDEFTVDLPDKKTFLYQIDKKEAPKP